MHKLSKTELWVAVAAIVAAVGTAILDTGLFASSSTVAAIIGVVVVACTYIAGRSWEKAARAGRRPNIVFSGEGKGDSNLARSIRTQPPAPDEVGELGP